MPLYIGNNTYSKDNTLFDLLDAVTHLPSPLFDVKVDFDRNVYSMQPSTGPDLLITTREKINGQIKGKDGYAFSKRSKPDNNAYMVEQGFVGFTTNERIGTTNVQDCVALIIQDKQVKKTALARVTTTTKIKSIQNLLSYMPEGEKK